MKTKTIGRKTVLLICLAAMLLLSAAVLGILTLANSTTVQLTQELTASDEQTYRVTVTYDTESGIPEDAVLSVSELREGDEGYADYVARSTRLTGGSAQKTLLARAFDIRLLSPGTWEEYQPDGTVLVNIELLDTALFGEINVVHFGETEELMAATVSGSAVEFETGGFSVYVVIAHEGDAAVDVPRVEFHFVTATEDDNGTGTRTSTLYSFPNKGGSTQTSQILSNRGNEYLEQIALPPNRRVGGKTQYFFGWYVVDGALDSNGSVIYTDGNKVTYTWPNDPEQISFEKPITISGTFEVGSTITWTIDGVSGTAKLDAEGVAHVVLAPVYVDYQFISFHLGTKDDAALKDSILVRRIVVPGNDGKVTSRIGNVEAPSTNASRYVFAGWETVTSTGETKVYYNTEDTEGQERNILWANGSETAADDGDGYSVVFVSADFSSEDKSVDLYPVFNEARWINFNTGKSGNGASYVGARYRITNDDNSGTYYTSFPLSNRLGFELEGWYVDAVLDADGNITNLTTPADVPITYIDGTGNERTVTESRTAHKLVNGDGSLADTNYVNSVTVGGTTYKRFTVEDGKFYVYKGMEELTLYARWREVDDTTYSVLVWKQKVTDDVYADDAEKTYDYSSDDSAIGVVGRSGKTLAQLRSDGSLNVFEGKSITGFHCNTAKTTMSTATVAGDGTTVINVYYDRNVHTLTFRTGSGRNSNNNSNVASGYSYTLTTGTTTPQYAFIDGEVVELTRKGDAEPYTWTIPEYGYRYVENNDGGFVKVGDTYVPLEPVTETTTTYTANYRYTQVNNNNGTQYGIDSDGEYQELSRLDYLYTPYSGTPTTGTYYGWYNGDFVTLYYNNGTWYRTRSWGWGGYSYSNPYTGTFYSRSNQNNTYYIGANRYTGTRYTRTNDGSTNVTGNATLNPTELYYIDGNGGKVPVTAHTTSTLTGYTYDNNGTPVTYTDEQRYSYENVEIGSTPYNGDRYTRSGPTNSAHLVYVIKALYNQNISRHFPIPDSPEGCRWMPQNDSVWSQVLAYIDNMPDRDVSFVLDISTNSTKYLHYYVEALPGVTPTRTYNGKGFVEYTSIAAKYGFFTEAEDYISIEGFSKSSDYPPVAYNNNGNSVTVWNNSNALHIYCYYLRDSETLTYKVNYPTIIGLTYEDSGGESTDHDESILYEASLAGYDSAFIPNAPDHYTFMGWFENEGWKYNSRTDVPFNFNTTMPSGDKVIYAKWQAERFAISIDPNGGEIDHVNHSYTTAYSGYYWSGDRWGSDPTATAGTTASAYPFAVFNRDVIYKSDGVTVERAADTGYNRSDATLVNKSYGDTDLTEYELECNYVPLSDAAAAEYAASGGTIYYYVNSQYDPAVDGSGLPSDLRNAMYMTEAELHQYYLFYRDWVQGNIDGGYITGTTLLGEAGWRNQYVSPQKYRAPYEGEHYEFLGWYQVYFDDAGNETGVSAMPYIFDTPITAPITIRAYWRLDAGYQLLYNPEYTMTDGTIINGKMFMDTWMDPSTTGSKYTDGAKTEILQQPTGLTANGNPTEDYIFRGWQLVSPDGTPLEDGVYYDPGDAFTVAAAYADKNGFIHIRAVYEEKDQSYRRPEVATRLTVDANKGYYPQAFIDEEQALPAWPYAGTTAKDTANDLISFTSFQSNASVHLSRYATTGGTDRYNYFGYQDGFWLIGFDSEPNPLVNNYTAEYPADSFVSLPRKGEKTIYAVWEPMVYLNIVNSTENTADGIAGGPVTIELTETNGDDALYVVNMKNGAYERIPIADVGDITVPLGETLRLAVPYGKDKDITITLHNSLGVGVLMNVASALDSTVHQATSVKNGKSVSIDETLVQHPTGITVTLTTEKADRTIIYVDNDNGDGTGGATEEFYYSASATSSDPMPRRGRVGLEFLGWAHSYTATTQDYSMDEVITDLDTLFATYDTDGDSVITLYGVWKSDAERGLLKVYKQVPAPGNQSAANTFEFSLTLSGQAKKGSGYSQETISGSVSFTLAHNQYMHIREEQFPLGDQGRLRIRVTLQKYDIGDNGLETASGDPVIITWSSANDGTYATLNPKITIEETGATSTVVPLDWYNTTSQLLPGALQPDGTVTLVTDGARTITWDNPINCGGSVVVENARKTANVFVQKTVVDSKDLSSKPFDYTAAVEVPWGESYTLSPTSFSVNSGTAGHTITGVPIGSTVRITEAENTAYTTTASASVAAGTTSAYDSGSRQMTVFGLSGDATVTFTNTRIYYPVRIVLVGTADGGTTSFTGVESRHTLKNETANSMLVNNQYTSPGNNVIYNGDFSVGTYTLTQTWLQGGYLGLSSPVTLIAGADDLASNDTTGHVVITGDTTSGFTVTVYVQQTVDMEIAKVLIDPLIPGVRTFYFAVSYSDTLNGVTTPVSYSAATAIDIVSGTAEKFTVPVGAANLTIAEETGRAVSTGSSTTIAQTYETSYAITNGGTETVPLTSGESYTYGTVAAANGGDRITFTNNAKTVEITVKKLVATDDKTGDFTFTATLKNGATAIADYPIYGLASPELTDAGGQISFTLADGATNVLTIPVGALLTVQETGVSNTTDPATLADYGVTAASAYTVSGAAYDSAATTSWDEESRLYTVKKAPAVDLTVTFNNGPAGVDVKFLKVDSYGDPLSGAEFRLYTDSACNSPLTASGAALRAASDGSGVVHFEKVPNGVWYMKETVVPAGYVNGKTYVLAVGNKALAKDGLSTDQATVLADITAGTGSDISAQTAQYKTTYGDDYDKYAIFLVKDGKAVAVPDIAAYGIVNTPTAERKAILKKIENSNNAPLSGAVFDILAFDRTVIPTGSGCTSAADGVFWVGTLPYGLYYVHETTVPSGMNQGSGYGWWYTVRVDDSGVTFRGMTNEENPVIPSTP